MRRDESAVDLMLHVSQTNFSVLAIIKRGKKARKFPATDILRWIRTLMLCPHARLFSFDLKASSTCRFSDGLTSEVQDPYSGSSASKHWTLPRMPWKVRRRLICSFEYGDRRTMPITANLMSSARLLVLWTRVTRRN